MWTHAVPTNDALIPMMALPVYSQGNKTKAAPPKVARAAAPKPARRAPVRDVENQTGKKADTPADRTAQTCIVTLAVLLCCMFGVVGACIWIEQVNGDKLDKCADGGFSEDTCFEQWPHVAFRFRQAVQRAGGA